MFANTNNLSCVVSCPDDGARMVLTLTTRYRSAPVPLESEYEQEKIPVLSRVGGESGHLQGMTNEEPNCAALCSSVHSPFQCFDFDYNTVSCGN